MRLTVEAGANFADSPHSPGWTRLTELAHGYANLYCPVFFVECIAAKQFEAHVSIAKLQVLGDTHKKKNRKTSHSGEIYAALPTMNAKPRTVRSLY